MLWAINFMISSLVIGISLVAPVMLDQVPCVYCIWQRYPWLLLGLWAMIGGWSFQRFPDLPVMIFFCFGSVILLACSLALGLFHRMVEMGLLVAPCPVPELPMNDFKSFEEAMKNTLRIPPCDAAQSLLGIPYTVYNVITSTVLLMFNLKCSVRLIIQKVA